MTTTELVDAWHALEYMAAAARLLEQRERRQPGSYRRCRERLLEESGGAERLVQTLRGTGLQHAQDENGGRPGHDAIRYIEARMDYAGARARGLRSEAARSKTLVSIRMRRAGSRWKPKTGNEILQLRALQMSDRWDPRDAPHAQAVAQVDPGHRPLRRSTPRRLSRAISANQPGLGPRNQ